MDIKTVFKWDTAYTADCIDFCLNESCEYFVVGTYQLQDESQRVGQLSLFSHKEVPKLVQQIDTTGILDVKWQSNKQDYLVKLGVVDSEGYFSCYNLNEDNLLKTCSSKISSSILLYLDWAKCSSSANRLTISDTQGYLKIISIDGSGVVSIDREIKAHDYETWVTRFNNCNSSIVYSGADDCRFKGFDMRMNSSIFCLKEHSAGVTAIEQSSWQDHLLFTGCYDGWLNCWDTRKMSHPLTKTNLGGGVWRVKCNPDGKPFLLTSLMHEGFKILQLDQENNSTKVVCHYTEHKSLAYGADWSKAVTKENEYTIGSISFYDHLFCLWRVKI